MKFRVKLFSKFLRNNFFLLFAILSFVLPDFLLRNLISPSAFSEVFVEPVSWAFSLCWIVLIVYVFSFMLPKKWGRTIYIFFAGTFIVYSLCQYVYFRIFDQFFWIKSIALAGEGTEYLGYAAKYIDARLLICTGFAILSTVVSASFWTSRTGTVKKTWWIFAVIPVLCITALHISMLPQVHGDSEDDWDSWRKPRVVYKQFDNVNKSFDTCGLYQFAFRDIYNTFIAPQNFGKKDFEKVDNFFAQKGEPYQNDYTGIFKGKNVIAVMLEGIDTWMIDPRYTPTICKMMRDGISFENYYSPFFGTGHTFNAEFAFNTGYFSPISAVSAVNFSANSYPLSLPNLFREAGYSVNSFHYNDAEFYNRGIMHSQFGYEKYYSFAEFGMPENVAQADSNILKDDAIYKKITEGQPFFSFIITYSAHVPYTFDDAKLALAKANHPNLINPGMNKEKNNCLILAADTDDFFAQLLSRLEDDGLLDDTVILAYTDHYAYGFSDQELLKKYKKNEILYRVPAFIYAKEIPKTKVSKPMMTVDWLPTIANMFDLKASPLYIGNDIFDNENQGFVYFGDSSWLDSVMYSKEVDATGSEENQEYIQKQNKRVKQSLEINDIVITGDYFSHK